MAANIQKGRRECLKNAAGKAKRESASHVLVKELLCNRKPMVERWSQKDLSAGILSVGKVKVQISWSLCLYIYIPANL